jgi:hypothetical protein
MNRMNQTISRRDPDSLNLVEVKAFRDDFLKRLEEDRAIPFLLKPGTPSLDRALVENMNTRILPETIEKIVSAGRTGSEERVLTSLLPFMEGPLLEIARPYFLGGHWITSPGPVDSWLSLFFLAGIAFDPGTYTAQNFYLEMGQILEVWRNTRASMLSVDCALAADTLSDSYRAVIYQAPSLGNWSTWLTQPRTLALSAVIAGFSCSAGAFLFTPTQIVDLLPAVGDLATRTLLEGAHTSTVVTTLTHLEPVSLGEVWDAFLRLAKNLLEMATPKGE